MTLNTLFFWTIRGNSYKRQGDRLAARHIFVSATSLCGRCHSHGGPLCFFSWRHRGDSGFVGYHPPIVANSLPCSRPLPSRKTLLGAKLQGNSDFPAKRKETLSKPCAFPEFLLSFSSDIYW